MSKQTQTIETTVENCDIPRTTSGTDEKAPNSDSTSTSLRGDEDWLAQDSSEVMGDDSSWDQLDDWPYDIATY